jgi:hypothetical protein
VREYHQDQLPWMCLNKIGDTSSTDSSKSEISISDVLGREGVLGTVLDVVNTEQKYLLKRSAFSPGVLAVCPLYVMTDSTPER